MIDEIKIMQLADGNLDPKDREEVLNAIQEDPKLQKILKDYEFTRNILFLYAEEVKSKPLPEKLLKKIETVLDKDNPTSQEIHDLMEEISSFFDNESADPMQETLNKYYQSLKNQAQGELNVLIKGKIILDNDEKNNDFSKIKITVIDLSTKKIVALCSPTIADGKYFIILKPANKYQIIIEREGFQKYTKNFSLAGTSESYEMSQEIRLIK